MRNLASELARIRKSGREVAVVTSGAIGAGMEALGMRERPTSLPDLQMAASVGQSRLMGKYDALFSSLGCLIGQVLLTHDDFQHKLRFTNAKRTLENLLRTGVIPIINENDVVADEEIKADLSLGDNDVLAAMVVKMIRADLLILLSTVDGLRETLPNGKTRRIGYVESINRETFALVTGKIQKLSKGGMSSKLKAAQEATKSGCAVVIANGRDKKTLPGIINGEDVGTLLLASAL